MGLFLSLSAVLGRSRDEVVASLHKYACSKGGGLELADELGGYDQHCIIHEANGNTTVIYPSGYFLWDETSAFLSSELNTPVFFFHIHDDDLWMYELFNDGEVVDQFNTQPRYWDDELTDEEADTWNGNADIIAHLVPRIQPEDVAQYFVRHPEEAAPTRAYFTDEHWSDDALQLVDFMRRLGFEYQENEAGIPTGQWHKLFTAKYAPQVGSMAAVAEPEVLRVAPPERELETTSSPVLTSPKKPWWKFW